MSRKVALIGVGAMGTALLHRLTLAGMKVNAFDIAAPGAAAARTAGATVFDSPCAAIEDAVFVHILVRTDDEVMDVTLGDDGVLAAMPPDAVLLLHSTVMPETTRRIGEAATRLQREVMDAPITAIPRRLHAGQAVFLTGGSDVAAARTRPHLEALGKAMYHFGPLGSGNVVKLAKNLATAIERVAAAEVVWLAEKGGVDPRAFLEMMRIEHTDPLFQRWSEVFTVDNGHVVAKPATNLLNKDVRLASDYAASVGLRAPMTEAAADVAADWVGRWANGGKVTS